MSKSESFEQVVKSCGCKEDIDELAQARAKEKARKKGIPFEQALADVYNDSVASAWQKAPSRGPAAVQKRAEPAAPPAERMLDAVVAEIAKRDKIDTAHAGDVACVEHPELSLKYESQHAARVNKQSPEATDGSRSRARSFQECEINALIGSLRPISLL